MKKICKKSQSDLLPENWQRLIDEIRKNHPESGGIYRSAVAEIQALASWQLSKATVGLKRATWILAVSTIVLCVATWIKN